MRTDMFMLGITATTYAGQGHSTKVVKTALTMYNYNLK